MRKKSLLTVSMLMALLFLIVPQAFNTSNQPAPGYTNAPGEGNCSTSGCHVSTPIVNRAIFRIDINSRPATYDTSVTYNMFVSMNSFPEYGFQVTALDANGFKAGNFTLTNPTGTSLNTGGNGRQYVGHNNANSTSAWVFRWKPTAYVGPVTFYVSGLGSNNDNTVNGDQTYLDTLIFQGQGQPANINADFSISNNTVCVGDPITFTNTSTGTITTYNWDFGSGAAPATANTVGPHSVSYSTTGTKTITLTVGDGSLTDTETKTVTVVSAPTADAGADQTICIGGSATLTATGGGNYTWSNGAGNTASVTVSPLTTTTYTVTVTAGTCSATDQVVVTVNPAPIADAGPNDTVCLGQPTVLTASGGVSYLWSTTQNTATITGVLPAPGSYTAYVTVTDANGCQAVDSVVAVVNALPAVNVADATTCGTGTATLDAGAGFASYLWSNSDATQTTTVSNSGSYSVTVTDANGCTNADTATANILTSLIVTLNDTTICPGGSVVLDAGYPGATYAWSTSATTQTITVSTPGTYSVTVTDGSCSGSEDAVVSLAILPSVGAGADATICAGDVANLGDADSLDVTIAQLENFNGCALPTGWTANALTGSANWSFSVPSYGGGSINGSCLAHYNDDDAGASVNKLELLSPAFDATTFDLLALSVDVHFREYLGSKFTIQVWDGIAYQDLEVITSNFSGTTWASYQTVVLDLTPYINPNLHIRFEYDDLGGWEWWAGIDNFIIGGVPAGIYSWSPTTGLTNPNAPLTTARPLATTSYVLSANVNGCVKTDTVVVTVNQSPAVSLSGIATDYCADNNTDYILTGTPAGGTFSGPGVTGTDFNPSDAGVGTHNVIYSYFDAGLGCTGRDTITVTVHPIPVISFNTASTFYCLDAPAFALSANPAGGSFSGAGVSGGNFDPSVAGVGTHTITYNYTSAAGCAASASIAYTVVDFEPTLSGLAATYCESDNTPVALTGAPAGGTFSGLGVAGSTFTPALAGSGVHDVIYTYDSLLGYSIDTNFAFNPVTGGTPTAYSFFDDDEELSTPINIGFNFNFFGQDYSQVLVSTNGFITFDLTETDPAFSNQVLPDTTDPDNLVAFMWDDLEFAEFDYYTVGTAPNRSFVIDYSAFHFFSANFVIAQVVLQEGSNEVQIHCINCLPDDGGPSATQGIENASGTRGFVVPGRNNTGWGSVGKSVRFIPSSCSFTTVEQVTVSGVTVDIADTSICSGESVTITASGSSSYAWSHGPTTASVTISPNDTTVYVVTGTDGACITTDTAVVNVRPGVNATISGLRDTVCSGDLAIALIGTPVGGTFSGPGVIGSVFNPSQANPNTINTIEYAVTNAFGCTDTATFNVYISPSPSAQFTLVDTAYCLDALPVTLTATPAGGTFSGQGISNDIFVPYFAGVGVHQLVYRVSVAGGCDALDTISVTVYDLPVVTFDPISPQYCAQSDSVQLVGSPVGGTFSGLGINNDYFNPTVATTGGPYIIQYAFTDGNGCTAKQVQLTEVVDNPTLQWVGLSLNYCINGDSVALQALPAGGTFSGNGVNGNYFNPAIAGAGPQTVTYSYTDGAGCDASMDASVTVHDVLPIGIDNVDSTYCVNDPYVILSGFPTGGVWSGNGVVGDVFSPDTSGTGGPYTITYTFTDGNGCVTSSSASTRIKPATNLLLDGLGDTYCVEDDFAAPIDVAPSGGTLYGSGLDGNSFNPSQAGIGTYIISYEYTNSEGCTSYAYTQVDVNVCTGIEELQTEVQIGLYPNPTSGVLNFAITGLDGQNIDATVFNLQGQRVLATQFKSVDSNQALQLELGMMAAGTYLVQIQAGNYSSVHRVVLNK